ncbi:oligosaccharide flippase family protein [Methylotenera sp.]|uniref:oligosaccharide flippase family protein n=1 Tax=Methylotenera sp. TaxID=2051956 RepID=UPI00273094BD|nr:oligosaccharide flippase family protein [Methylotenera sp.]MDP2071931.1 oligosaccharide flippase family protein [Methylotenera sp.]MDP3005556.1 oligosaccharide flippase family protein [Methylotenera sp.]
MSLRRNTIWNLAGSGLPLIAAVALIPFTLNRLGNEAFGVLTLIWALIGYFSLFDMGVGRALTYELSKLRVVNNVSEISLTLKAGLMLTLAAGLLGAAVMLILAPYLATSWLKISPALQQDAMLSFKIAAIGVIPTTITSGLRGALEGLGRFAASNLNKIFLGFCMFVLPALSIALHGNHLWAITLYLVLARLLVLVAATIQLKEYIFAPTTGLIKKHLKPLVNYGVWVTVTGIVGPLMVYGDRFFVSAVVGAALLPLYAIPQEGLQRLLMIPAALCGALLPQLAALSPQNAAATYQRNYKRVAVVMFGICLLAALLAYPALAWWLSVEFAKNALPIVLILSVGIWLNSMALVPYTLMHANGNPRLTALFHLFELALYVLALWWLATNFGLIGAALAWVGRVALDLILLHIAANKLLRVSYEKA